MKIVALEEHFATAEVMQGWKSVDPRWSDLALKPSTEGEGARRLLDLGAERLDAMNEAGIDVGSFRLPRLVSRISMPRSRLIWRDLAMITLRRQFIPRRSDSRALQLCQLLHRTVRRRSWCDASGNSACTAPCCMAAHETGI